MRHPFIAAAIAGLAATAKSLYFSINPLSIDQHLTPPSLQINFTVRAPGSVFEQGGPDPAHPGRGIATCWNSCAGGSGKYFTRVTPGSFSSTSNYSLDIWQAYVYELGNHNNATIAVSRNDTCADYTCTKGPEDITCQTGSASEDFNATYTAYYGGADPPSDEICDE